MVETLLRPAHPPRCRRDRRRDCANKVSRSVLSVLRQEGLPRAGGGPGTPEDGWQEEPGQERPRTTAGKVAKETAVANSVFLTFIGSTL